jgi:hypothetical protein
MIIFIGALSFFISLPLIGMITILPLLAIASILGGFIGELLNIVLPINLKLVEGGGSPTLITQLLALIVYIVLGALIGWFYGKHKKKRFYRNRY